MGALADLLLATDEEDSPILRESRRVASLPIAGPLTPEEVEAISLAELAPAAYAEGFRLREVQARAFLAAFASATEHEGGGAVVPAAVSAGKTLLGFLILKLWLRLGARRVLLHVPSRAVVQTLKKKIPHAWRVLGMDVPVYSLAGLTPEKRWKLASRGWRGLYIMPYSLLSADDADAVLEAIDPDGVIADECHHLAVRAQSDSVRASARTRRWLVMMRERQRRGLFMSGTMDARSVRDSHHLATLALGDQSPLPVESTYARMWADVLDADKPQEPPPERVRALMPILEWAIHAVKRGLVSLESVKGPLVPDAQGLRRAYRLRRDATPGVIASSGDDGIGASLWMRNTPVPGVELTEARANELEGQCAVFDPDDPSAVFVPAREFAHLAPVDKMLAFLWAVDRRQRTPGGDVIAHAFHGWRWKDEISSGFYNDQVWPTVEKIMEEQGLDEDRARDVLDRSRDQHRLWQKYTKKLRRFLEQDHRPGLDTPELVGTEIKHHGARRLPEDLVEAWKKAKAAIFEGMVERRSKVERVSDYKIRHALEWAKREVGPDEGAIVWVHNVEMGAWTYEVFRAELGPDRVLHCPESTRADRDLADPEKAGKRICVLSLPAHHQAKDLEYFRHQFFLQSPRVAKVIQQAIGRVHRSGQKADELFVDFCLTTGYDHQNYSAMLRDAVYAHVTDQPQKVVYADYESSDENKFPKKFPPLFLLERGFEVRPLGADGEKVLSGI